MIFILVYMHVRTIPNLVSGSFFTNIYVVTAKFIKTIIFLLYNTRNIYIILYYIAKFNTIQILKSLILIPENNTSLKVHPSYLVYLLMREYNYYQIFIPPFTVLHVYVHVYIYSTYMSLNSIPLYLL